MKIERISLRPIWNSSARPTLEIALGSKKYSGRAALPSGQSRGGGEAAVLDQEAARAIWPELERQLLGRDFDNIQDLDRFLLRLDGTRDRSRLGGNVILGLSLAFARVLSARAGVPLWQVLRGEFFPAEKGTAFPVILANFLEGGAHAPGRAAFQEYLVLADTSAGPTEAVARLVALYHALGVALGKKMNGKPLPLGAEAGYVFPFRDESQPLTALRDLLRSLGADQPFRLGIDCAANHFASGRGYILNGVRFSPSGLLKKYAELLREPLLSYLEDPFREDDPASFAKLRGAFPERWITGDDLTVTRAELIRKYGRANALKAVIIKANQAGSLSETCAALQAAKAEGLARILSHRGEETEDCFLVHIARAANAEGLKIGPPVRERVLKYNEFLRLY